MYAKKSNRSRLSKEFQLRMPDEGQRLINNWARLPFILDDFTKLEDDEELRHAIRQSVCPKSKNLGMLVPGVREEGLDWMASVYGIPAHLVVYSIITLISMALYIARLYWGWEYKCEGAPSLFRIVTMR